MKKNIIFFLLIFCLTPYFVSAERFFVERSHDKYERRSVEADAQVVTEDLYFYFDNEWWEELDEEKQEEYKDIAYNLGNEFKNTIYPQMSKIFGTHPEHSVSKEKRISVLFHPMEENSGGYFSTGDQYSVYQYPRSNERNILYLSTDIIENNHLPGYFAHEYMHLVTFNEKDKEYRVSEEVWLNELRAEVVATIFGYDAEYKNSNLQRRVSTFLRDPDISLTEWTEQLADYGVANIFAQYIIDHYGEEVLADSLRSELVGIPSIDYALYRNEIDKTFSEIFTQWKIAVYLNDCDYGEYYCFKNENLKDLRIQPTTIFITQRDSGIGEITYQTKNWAGNWFRFVGGSGDFHLNFYGSRDFVVPYIVCKKEGSCEIEFLESKRSIVVEDFNNIYESVTIIPSVQGKYIGFNGAEKTFPLRIEVEIKETNDEEKAYKERLSELVSVIKRLAILLEVDLSQKKSIVLENDLYYGMENSKEVEELQRFLKNQGEEIYPEGLVTGNFLELTKEAVIRFQEFYAKDILDPLSLSKGTGYVGSYTRNFINSFSEK